MILNPRPPSAEQPVSTKTTGQFIPAWDAVFGAQKAASSSWLLIAQPDHAALAGDLAQAISSSLFPRLEDEVIHATSLHDEGWQSLDKGAMIRDGRPLSFLDFGPTEFLEAWIGSISTAEAVGPIAGLLVSGHFVRLARVHIEARGENSQVRKFLVDELARQERLIPKQNYSQEELSVLTDVLQFCDLLSLYLCCGSQDAIEFPQRFDGHSIRLYREGGMCCLEPPLFAGGISLGVFARNFPGAAADITIPILLG